MTQTFSFEPPDVNRFYLSGVVLNEICQGCGEMLTWNGKDHYLLNPTQGEEHTIYFNCKCGQDVVLTYKFEFEVKVTPCIQA